MDKARKSRAGRKPWDAIVMFKTIILARSTISRTTKLSQIRDLSFKDWLGHRGPGSRRQDGVAVPRTVNASWRDRGLIRPTFDGYLKDQGIWRWAARSTTPRLWLPKQRNSREENARIKAGETPAGWEDKPATAPKGCRGAVDQEARQEPLRLQEPCQRGPSAQAGAALSCERRGGARQPSPRRWLLDGDNTALGICGRTALTARRRSRRR